ncbi:hypothetical protein GCK72_015246 [Caenorhabditis remanei]|uniref:Uncharacterized protein n=1 Tax=Caenorhabditis remanei TaxID=31234 RepID=A0A6A5GW01_CAERE|nr:hypothetical protein GCK72_015246 [Caenorhabditis remanei]KAF1758786.1 hypothetical protein GCK72_015246 [Caenorhabditis remanei]
MKFVTIRRILNAFLNVFRKNPKTFNEVDKYLKERNVWRFQPEQYFELWRIFGESTIDTCPMAVQLVCDQIAAEIAAHENWEKDPRGMAQHLKKIQMKLGAASTTEKYDHLKGKKRFIPGGGGATAALYYIKAIQKKFRPEQIMELAEIDMLPTIEVTQDLLNDGIMWEMKHDSLGAFRRHVLETSQKKEGETEETGGKAARPRERRHAPLPIQPRLLEFYERVAPYIRGKPFTADVFKQFGEEFYQSQKELNEEEMKRKLQKTMTMDEIDGAPEDDLIKEKYVDEASGDLGVPEKVFVA